MSEPFIATPLSPLRKVIAARMTESKRTIPHFRLVTDIHMDALLAVREQLNCSDANNRISINDFLIKACASALLEHPAVNVQLVDDSIHQYAEADISVVISIEGGLATPIVRGANRKSVRDISVEMKALVTRATARQLKMDEILGGSFSISNLGAYGIDQFDAIINPPQCAILAVGSVKPRTVVALNGEIRAARVLRATLSVDHRAIDGATAAAFLATLRQKLEQPKPLFDSDAADNQPY